MTILVVGAGITGATIARILADNNKEVIVVEKLSNIGGACQDKIKKNAYLQKHGAHIFHTNNKVVWDFMGDFCKWMPYQHKVLGCINGTLVPIPFNINSIEKLFSKAMVDSLTNVLEYGFSYTLKELSDIKNHNTRFLSTFIFENVFKDYSLKQWGKMPDTSVLDRVKAFRFSRDDRYFQDKYQGIPQCGYSTVIERMLTHKNIELNLSAEFTKSMLTSKSFDTIFYTGSIDELLDYKYGVLPYRTCKFEKHFYTGRYLQREAAVINYPNDYDFTRAFDCSWFMPNCSNGYFVKEYPKRFSVNSKSEMRYYPVNDYDNKKLYSQYANDIATNYPNVILAGRQGLYKYMNMDEAIKSAIVLIINYFEKDFS